MVYQYAINISEVASFQEVANLATCISHERREKLRKFRFDKDKLHCMFAEMLLKYALHERYAINDFHLERNAYGKPSLVERDDIFFNLSHSGDWVVCGVGDQNLGIDVERMEEIERNIADEFFSKKEVEFLKTISEKDWLDVFYSIWTLKESYTKNVGEGLSIPLDSFSIIPNQNHIVLYIREDKSEKFFFQTYSLDAQHKLALCVSGGKNNSGNDLKILSLKDFIQEELLCWNP